LADHLSDVKMFFNKFDGFGDMNEMVKAMTNGNESVQDGLQYTLTQMNKLDPSVVERFDMKFATDGIECANCRFDVELVQKQTGGLKFLEYKSYADASGIQLSQFKSYLQSINSLDELNYVFNALKLSIGEAKAGMKIFFTKGSNTQDIFQTIWNNRILRNNLLNSPQDEIQGLQRFLNLLSEIDHPTILNPKLYSFIKVQ